MTARDEIPLSGAELREAARSHKTTARARLATLRAELHAALRTKKARMKAFAEECARERLAVRGAIFAMKETALAALRDELKAARLVAKERRAARRVEAESASLTSIATARAALDADRQHRAEQNRIATHGLRRKAEIDKVHAQTLASGALHGPKLEKLRPLLEKARSIKPSAGESKAEALWRYAKAHPEEMHAILEPKAAEAIAKTKAEIASVEQSVRAPNAFELKRAARIERMRTRSEKLKAEAHGAFAREHAIAERIPMGQPILVGHHSEKRHRRDLKKMDALMTKGVALSKEAEALARRAAFAERSTAVSSDDPEALTKLRAKLASMGDAREKMKAANAAIRKGGDVLPRLVRLGFTEKQATHMLNKDPMGRVGFPPYVFQNSASEESRIKERIRVLEERASKPAPLPETIGEAVIHEAENRVRITFPGKPGDETRRGLKGAGFRWSPTANAWQRFASTGAWYDARRILAKHGQPPHPSPAPHATAPRAVHP